MVPYDLKTRFELLSLNSKTAPYLGPRPKLHLFPSLLNLRLSFHFLPSAQDLAALSLHRTSGHKASGGHPA